MNEKAAIQYRGRRLPTGCIIKRQNLTIPGRRSWSKLSPLKSLRLRSHSPDGFEWGYGGSGPAQTALAPYQDFKFKIVANLTDDWELSGYQISEAIEAIRADRMRNR